MEFGAFLTERYISTREARSWSDRKMTVLAYVGLGSNLGDRDGTLRAALAELAAAEGVRVAAVSSFCETDPVGPVLDQPRFMKAVAALEADHAPRTLLEL